MHRFGRVLQKMRPVSLGLGIFAINTLNQTQTQTSCNKDWRNGSNRSRNGNVDKLIDDLKGVLKADQIDVTKEECELRGKPWNSYHNSVNHPDAILQPETTEDVSSIMRLCSLHNIPVIPYGGGTSLEGQLLTPEGGISLDFCRMKKVIAVREGDLDVTVQAGLGYIELNEYLRPTGLWFPLDPGPGATIGGMVATRCSGSTAVRYGSMRENVLNVTAVMSDGTIVRTGGRARKSSAGYDLTRLFVGSEGTLAVVTEATLKVHPIPTVSHAVRIAFPTVELAAKCASETLRKGLTVGRCELMDEVMVRDINLANPQLPSMGGAWAEEVTLLYELTGPSESSVAEQTATLKELATKNNATAVKICTEPEQTALIWKTRKECLWSTMSQHPGLEPMITDVCVPLSHLPELIREARRELDASPLHCPIIAHAGDGNIHVLIMFDTAVTAQKVEAQRLADLMARHAIRLGGTCTGEHGVGVGKRHLLKEELGAGSIAIMRSIKDSLDPANLLNPGKVLPPKE